MKHLIASLALVLAIGSVALAGSYDLVSIPAPGYWSPPVAGVGKVVQIEVTGSAVADGTVQLYKMAPGGASSNLMYTVTCSSGAAVAALSSTNTFYIAAGETIYRAGTATNGAVRLILQ
jgi:hypothetical protein